MTNFIGDYDCKIDAKGRINFPSAFNKQMTSSGQKDEEKMSFVVKKDIFEKCLVLFPMEEWERQLNIIRKKINPYKREHNQFLREFHRGKAEVTLDSANRLLIPKRLTELVEIKKEVVLAGLDGKIEIWSKEIYDQVGQSQDEFAQLAEKIMGDDLMS